MLIQQIEEKLRQAQKLVAEAKELASDNGLLLYYKIHEFNDMGLEDITRDSNYWDSSSFCADYRDDTYY